MKKVRCSGRVMSSAIMIWSRPKQAEGDTSSGADVGRERGLLAGVLRKLKKYGANRVWMFTSRAYQRTQAAVRKEWLGGS